jgi:hypothetical protein
MRSLRLPLGLFRARAALPLGSCHEPMRSLRLPLGLFRARAVSPLDLRREPIQSLRIAIGFVSRPCCRAAGFVL